jgi:anti-sigma B factor antagonist
VPSTHSEVKDGLLTVQQVDEPERIRLSLEGELDLSNAPTAELKLDEALCSGSPVLVDLSKLEFLDSTGIALLVAALQRHESARLTFLPSKTVAVRRLMSLTGLDQRLPLASVEGEGESLLSAP